MPLDPMFVNPMLDPFRTMMAEVDGKQLSGTDVDRMRELLAHMERLAAETDDIAAYSGRLAQDNSFQEFGEAYGRALAAQASGQHAEMSDGDMLANTLRAYEDALGRYRSGQVADDAELLIPALERVVAIGRSGVSFPVFLRMLEEEQLTRVLDGAAPTVRAALEREVGFARQSWQPHRVEQTEKLLTAFDQLVSQAPGGQPDPLALELARRRIEWEYAPIHRRWDAVIRRWQQILTMLVDWIDSYATFAPHDPRWKPTGASAAEVQRNIERTRECTPGELAYRLGILSEYFHLTVDGIWTHDSFRYEYTARRVAWSDDRLALIRQTLPCCVPGGAPPHELVARAESLHPRGDVRPDAGKPPPWGTPLASPF